MRTKRPIVSMIVLCFACAAHALAGPLIGASFDGTIYDVDPATGLATNPRESGLDRIAELAFSADGDLFASNYTAIYRITPGGDPPELIGGEMNFAGWEGIAFDPITDVLYGSVNFGGIPELYTLDIASGEPLLIGGVGSFTGAIAFSPDGRLYLRESAPRLGLLELDKLTATVLNEATLNMDLGTGGMTFSQDGTMYIVDGGVAGTDTLYTLDPSTGILSSVGHTGLDDGLFGLAYIPEPSTLVLLLVGVVVSVRGRRLLRRGR